MNDNNQIELSCKEAARLLSQRLDRPLDASETRLLKEHLYECLNCERFAGQLDFLSRLAKKYAEG